MNISDLDYLELASEVTDIIGGDGAAVEVSVSGLAEGQFTLTNATTYSYARALPENGAVAVGVGTVVVVGFTLPKYPKRLDGRS